MERVDGTISQGAARLGQSISFLPLGLARICFAATVVLVPFRMRMVIWSRPMGPIYHDYTDILLFATDLFLIATLALWVMALLLQPRRLKAGPSFISIPIAGVTVIAAFSTFASVDPAISLYHVFRLVLLAALYLYVVNEVTFDRLIPPLAIQVFIQSAIGIAQVLQQHSLGLGNLQELELDPAWSGVSIIWADGVRSLRAYGLTDHPNILGGCLAFGLLLLALWYGESTARWHATAMAVVALGTIALFVTFSRAAWMAFAGGAGLCVLAFLRTGRRRVLARWLNLASGCVILLFPFVWHNLPNLGVRLNANDAFAQVALENRSISERDNLVGATLQIWREHPFLGIGLGALPEAERLRYPNLDDLGADYQPAHLVVLDVAAETGVTGALFYLMLSVSPWAALWWNRRRLTFTPALIGTSGILLAVTLVSLLDYYTWLLAPGQLWQWLVWGAWGAAYSSSFVGA